MGSVRINIGELDTPVKVYTIAQTIGTKGERINTPTLHSEVFAKVESAVAEGVQDYNLAAKSSLKLTMYKIAGMSTRWRVVVDNATYEITDIDEMERTSNFCVLSVSSIDG